jgi:phenol hydroxylase P2 protein
MSNVFIAFQANEDSRPIVDAILADNPHASAVYSPGLVKIDAPDSLTIKRATIEAHTGSSFDLHRVISTRMKINSR